MKILPLDNIIQLKIEEAKVGILDTSSRQSAVEYAEVVATGSGSFDSPKVGDHVFVKAWAIDIIQHEEKKYYFCDIKTNGILAVVK